MNGESVEDIYELSPLQQGMLFHSLMEPTLGLYFEQVCLLMPGRINLPAFEQAWQQIVDRNPTLRMSFYWQEIDKPLQVVHRRVRLPLHLEDWSAVPPVQQAARFKAFLEADRARGFDLSQAPLMRLSLIRLSPDRCQFVASFHHILLDGWSVKLVFQELATLYDALCRGRRAEAEPRRPYRDYIAWLQGQDLQRAEAFWRRRLAGFAAPPPLGGEPQAAAEGYGEREIQLGQELTGRLQDLSRRAQITLNTVVQGAWALLLSRYLDVDDVVFGAIVSGRPADLEGVEAMVGLFINTLPVRVQIPPAVPVSAWLRGIQARQLECRQHEYSPLVQVQGWSAVPRHTPLFETLLIFENLPGGQEGGAGAARARAVERTNYPLTLLATPGPRLGLQLLHVRPRFDGLFAARLLGHLATLLDRLAAGFEQPLAQLSLLTDPERQQLLREWNDTRADAPLDRCLHDLFATQAGRTPGATALLADEGEMTYGDIDRRANQLAWHLRRRGVGRGTLAAVCLERSPDMVVALLGILKAGAAYVPLDPAYPRERLAWMLEDSGAAVLLTHERLAAELPARGAVPIYLDREAADLAREKAEPPAAGVEADEPAYLMYTSGSTGRPKGVLGLHRATVNRLAWMWDRHPFAPGELAAQKTALSFVDSVWEVFGPLLQGVPTAILPDAVLKDPARLIQALAARQVTRLVLVPSLLRALLESEDRLGDRLPCLNTWVCSGEALPADLVRTFRERVPGATLINLYGSSEVAADVTACEVSREAPAAAPPLGRPLANCQAYVLDSRWNPVPAGVPGELFVGGEALACGYLGRPDLTAERFVPDPFGGRPGARLYRTGDRAGFLPDGEIRFHGRVDHQVKLRGFRVEPGEVEAALVRHPALREAVVAGRRNASGDGYLAAYLVAHPEQTVPPADELRPFLRGELPEHMIPAVFVPLEELPRTPNGKVDRKALPAPVAERPSRGTAPRTPVEEGVVRLWAEILELESVGIHDDFLELGGHSLLAMRLLSRLRRAFDVELPLRAVFECPTPAGMAEEIEAARLQGQRAQEPEIRRVSREGRRVALSPQGTIR